MNRFEVQGKSFKALKKLFDENKKNAKSKMQKQDAIVMGALCTTLADLCKIMKKEDDLVKNIKISKRKIKKKK